MLLFFGCFSSSSLSNGPPALSLPPLTVVVVVVVVSFVVVVQSLVLIGGIYIADQASGGRSEAFCTSSTFPEPWRPVFQ